jgi:prepilin-type N-terminal cleavage/methylation domain-containing protein
VGKGTNNRGFSLVEILVVLLVIALVGSLVALSVDSGSSAYEVNAANRMFRALANQARDEAELTGLDHGLTLEMVSDERGDKLLQYRWWRRTQQPLYEFFAGEVEPGVTGTERNREVEPEWEVLNEVLYQTRTLPANLELKMSVGNIPVDLARIKPRKGNKQIAPLMVFYASGEATPAVVEFLEKDTGDSLWRYQWDLLGELELEWRGEVTEDG